MPGNVAIFLPVAVLALWTLVVLLLMSFSHIGAARRAAASAVDPMSGASAAAPTRVNIPNRNFMNLLEVPVLFYVACIVLYVTGGASYLTIVIAWIYVALRIVHSAIHLTYNTDLHRSAVFAVSNVVVVVLWVLVVVHVTAATAAY